MGTTHFSVLSRRSYQLGSVICRAFSISNASPNEFRLTECVTQRDEVLHAHGKWPINRTMLIFWLVTLFWLNYKCKLVLQLDFEDSRGVMVTSDLVVHICLWCFLTQCVLCVFKSSGKDKITFHWHVKCLSWQIKEKWRGVVKVLWGIFLYFL